MEGIFVVPGVVLLACVAAGLTARAQSAAPAVLASDGVECAPAGGACVDLDAPAQALGTIEPGTTLGLAQADAGTQRGFPLVFPNTRVAANGVSLRDVSSGGIQLVGIPPGSTVVAAYLYWSWISLPAAVPGLHDTLTMARVPRRVSSPFAASGSAGFVLRPMDFPGVLVGSGADPCWNGGLNLVYRADVSAMVQRGDSFLVWVPPGAAGASNYRDPWAFPFPVGPHCEGATLVVVYTNTSEFMGTTHIYDVGLAGNMFHAWPGTGYNLSGFFHPGNEARWIHVGADGQSGAGYQELHSMGLETTYFQGFPIAGPGSLTDSDWNGAGNKPLAILWDTSGHDVTPYLGPGQVTVNVSVNAPAPSVITDCLVPVCNVLWLR